jgi:hypothetical protein
LFLFLLSKHGAQLTPVLLHEDSTHSKTRGEGREGGRRSRLSKKVYWDQIRKSIRSCRQLHEPLSAIGYRRGCHVYLAEKTNMSHANTVCIRRRDIRKSTSVPTFLYWDPASLSSVSGSITPRMADTLPPSTPAPLTAECLQYSLTSGGAQERMSQGWQ